ncbi:leucine-rich repeat protein, partial [Metamycoplasma hyosynoviae]
NKYEIDLSTFVIEKLSDLVSINVHFRIKEKEGRPGIYSKQVSKTITGFKMPQELIENLAQKVEFDVSTKDDHMAYEFWDKFDSIDTKIIDKRCEFVQDSIKVKQTDADKITITYKVKDKTNNTISQEYSKTISDFKTSTDNTADFSYEIIEHNGHKVAFLNERKNLSQYKVPAKIGSYKVIKVGTLFSGVNRAHSNGSPLYGVVLEEGIQEVSNLIISSDYGEEYAKIAAIKLPKSIKKITSLINGDSSSLAYLEMYDNVETIEGQLFTTFCNYIEKSENYHAQDVSYSIYYFNLIHDFHSFFTEITADHGRIGKGSFRFNLLKSSEGEKLKLNTINEFSFLESADSKILYKVVDNKNSSTEFNNELQYEKISKNAFSGLNIEKINLHLSKLKHDEQKNFILERMKKLKEIKLTNHKFDQFPMRFLLNDITSLETITFPDFSSDSSSNILDFGLNGKSQKVNLPTNTKEIKAKIIATDNIANLKYLKQLRILHNNSFVNFKNTTLDFSECPLEEIKHQAFHWTTKNVNIILPNTVKKVEPFILYFTEANNKYNILNNPFDHINQLYQIQLTDITNVIIKVKGIQSKPTEWSDYWVGQYWKNDSTNGINGQLKIEWNQS